MTKHNKNTISLKAIFFLLAFLYFFYGYCVTTLRIHVTQDNTLLVSEIDSDELMKINGISALTAHYSIDCTLSAYDQETDITLIGIDADILPQLNKQLSYGNFYPIYSGMPYLLCTEAFIEMQFGKDKSPQACLNTDILLTYQDYSLIGKIYGILKDTKTAASEETAVYISPAWAKKLLEKEEPRPTESYLLIMNDQKAKEHAILSVQTAGGNINPEATEESNQIKSLKQDNHWRIISMLLCVIGFLTNYI